MTDSKRSSPPSSSKRISYRRYVVCGVRSTTSAVSPDGVTSKRSTASVSLPSNVMKAAVSASCARTSAQRPAKTSRTVVRKPDRRIVRIEYLWDTDAKIDVDGHRVYASRFDTSAEGDSDGSGRLVMRFSSTTSPSTRCRWMISSSTSGVQEWYHAPSG